MNRARRSPIEIARLCQEFRSSGLTVQDFAARHHVHAGTVRYWLRRGPVSPHSEPTRFVEVHASAPPTDPSEGLVLEFPDAARLHFARLPDPAYLLSLLQTLRGV